LRERNFAYAVARIRSLETKLLDASQLERLLNAGSFNDVLAQLGETEYAATLGSLKKTEEFEAALDAEFNRIIRLLLDLTGNAPELQVFIHRYDILNLKKILKAGDQKAENLSPLGVWPKEWLLERIETRDLSGFPPLIGQAIVAATDALKATGDIQEVDRILDAAWFNYGFEVLRHGISEPLFDWWISFIDLTNLRGFFRLRLIGMTAAEFFRFFINGGRLELENFKELWDQPNERVAAWLGNTPYHRLPGDACFADLSLTKLEREFDNFLIEKITPAKVISLGIEPLIGYFLAKENEVKILRIILVGKANQMSNSEIKERLRRAYA